MKDFSTIFKELRIERRMTQDELADSLGLSRSTIGMYESGKRFPDHAGLQRLADFFRVDTDYLLGRTDHKYCFHDEEGFWFFFGESEESEDLKELNSIIKQLNNDGQKELLKHAQLLLSSGKYCD